MKVNRLDIQIKANPKRVILNYLKLGVDYNSNRIQRLTSQILSFSEEEIDELYEEIYNNFSSRHHNFEYYIEKNFKKIEPVIPQEVVLSDKRKLVLGAYFSKEYSIQSAALFNPSMVAHPNQEGLNAGEKRFIISLRSVGEGHISSIEFRSGIVTKEGTLTLDKETRFASSSEKSIDKVYSKKRLLKYTALLPSFDLSILLLFDEEFTYTDYLKKVNNNEFAEFDTKTREHLFQILDTTYDVVINKDTPLCERVIFPNAIGESMGMEDVRFVKFTCNNETEYIGTYTAYDGRKIFPQLIITTDFISFKIRTMYGDAVNDKGMALFPEKINGKYVMLGRQGGENITIMFSEDLRIWRDYQVIMTPQDTWGAVQLGNCGSPIKTKEGWLVITHAVGPLRKYVLGAILLDLNNPAKIIKKLGKPLLSPNEQEREGYVPNVVYSCGSMEHEGNLIIPYAISDSASTFATIKIDLLLQEMDEYKPANKVYHGI